MPRVSYDEGWKEAIRTFFPQFMTFFFPEIAKHIDFPKGFEFLDKELSRISRRGLGRRRADTLVKVSLRDGGERWILVHVEIQGYPQEEFSKEDVEGVVRGQKDRDVLRRWLRLAIRVGSLEEFRREVEMRYHIFLRPVREEGFEGYYYAHITTLELTTHGKGIEGALKAAKELIEAWIDEKAEAGKRPSGSYKGGAECARWAT